jgi:peptidoglycan/LPS O-acetylase OafA/YrhL
VPGLDGLRAVAVLAVIAYHLGLPWASGGLLGVGVFFTLSGYLITDLLLAQWESHGRLQLRQFWLGRARRLLPALVVMLTVVAAWVTLLHRSQLAPLRGAVAAALGFVSNWWLIFQHVSYFDRFGPPAPLEHLWSLAVEEQFYLLWPWLLLLGLKLVRNRKYASTHPRLAAVTLLGAVLSAVLMAAQYHPGFDTTRVYDGTDTRAFGLLAGAALAMVWPSRHLAGDVRPGARRLLDAVGTSGLIVVLLLIWHTSEYSRFLYPGGMVLLSAGTVLVVAVVAHPATRLGAVLGWRPMRWLGVRSYGIYLWHLPVIVLTSPVANTAINVMRAIGQVTVTICLAALSWRYVEEPIRHGAIGRLWARYRTSGLRFPRGWGWAAPTAAFAVLATACVGLTSATPTPSNSPLAHAATSEPAPTSQAAHPSASRSSHPSSQPTSTPASGAPSSRSAAKPPAAPPYGQPAGTTTSCHSVTHIGDSTSDGLISPDYLPEPAQRIDAQYARVGATSQHIEISGGTSILETIKPGDPNAFDVASRLIHSGYHGCWVLALGTNDTADVYVGSALDRAGRVAKMMSVIGNQPVLWVSVKTLRANGPYAEANMQAWNNAVSQVCGRYPNLRIYDWASVVRNDWFIDDAIHFTSAGYAQRARLIADALAHAFPANGPPSPGCIIR